MVAPFPQADGGGITALVFNSADSPTPSEQTVSTRDAYDVAYEQSTIAIALGTTVMALWIDDAADAIYAASRVDGESTWTDEGEQVTASAGRTRLSGAEVDSDTVALAVAATTGDIFYYELDFSLAVPERWRQPRVIQGLISGDRRSS